MYGPEYRIQLRSSARTNKGRVRHNNEDNVHVWPDRHSVMAIVADGMGGAAAGEEASRLAIQTVVESMVNGHYQSPQDYFDMDRDKLAQKLRTVVLEANHRIVEQAQRYPEFKGMGTTLTMAFALHTEVLLAHVGDSRAYLVNGHNGDIIQLTADHSFVQALVDAGHIAADEAEDHPMKNVLYRALGQGNELDVDVHQDLNLHVGDRIVLCSDGLTLHVKAYEIADIVMAESDPDVCSQRLIDLANNRGGRDNISVIVIYAERENKQKNQDTSQVMIEDDEQETVDLLTYDDDDEEPTMLLRDRSPYDRAKDSSTDPRDTQTVEVTYSESDGEGRDILEQD